MSEKEVSRRGYVKYAGAGIVVIAVAGAGAYYATRPGPSPTPSPTTVARTETEVQTITEIASPTVSVPPDLPPSEDPIIFNGWSYRPDVVSSYLDEYMSQYNDNAQFIVVSGNYEAVIESKLIAGAKMDIFYDRSMSWRRIKEGGWIEDLNDLPEIEQIKKEMYPEVLASYTDEHDGFLACLHYHTSVWVPHQNMKLLGEAGLADTPPKNWQEIYDQCREIKRQGLSDTPMLPNWGPNFWQMPWQLLIEHQNSPRGGQLFDETQDYEPVFDTDTYLAELIEYWKAAYDDEIVTKDALTNEYADLITKYLSGKYAFHGGDANYQVSVFNDPNRSQFPGFDRLVPLPTGSGAVEHWGLIEPEGISISKKPRGPKKTERVQNLITFMSWKDINGEYYVPRTWAVNSLLVAGYPAVWEDPAVKAEYLKALPHGGEEDYNNMLDIIGKAKTPNFFKTIWNMEWLNMVSAALPAAVNGERSIPDVIEEILDGTWDLVNRYKREE